MADKVRLIDAKILKKYCLIEGDGDDEFTEGYNAAIVDVRGCVDNMPTIEAEPDSGWISVKDRLPKLGERVMAFCKASILTFLRYDGEVWFEMSSRNEYLPSFVTHWQHLPEPPKGE